MKIGIIIGSLGFGGAERVSVRLTEQWLKYGHSVSFFTTMKPAKQEYVVSKEIKRYDCHVDGRFRIIKRLHAAVVEDKPDIVLVMTTLMCALAGPALTGTKIPFVVSERSSPNAPGIKITTKILSHIFMRFADGFIFQTKTAQGCFSKHIVRKSVIIPNPLVLDLLPERYTGKRDPQVVAVGRLVKAKNYPLLISAFTEFSERHPDYTLEIFGDGALKKDIEELAGKSPVADRIHLNGIRDNVLECIVKARMYVMSSDFEGMPNSLLEAVAIGIPSVSTDCPSGGSADIVEQNENGILVPVGDKDALRNAMCMLAENESLCDKLSQNGVKIRKKYDIKKVGTEWMNFFEKILNRK